MRRPDGQPGKVAGQRHKCAVAMAGGYLCPDRQIHAATDQQTIDILPEQIAKDLGHIDIAVLG
ncbi:MAG: hypothetical protein ACM3X0_07210 [Bacteroidota bacterium]